MPPASLLKEHAVAAPVGASSPPLKRALYGSLPLYDVTDITAVDADADTPPVRDDGSLFSRLLFSYATPLMATGNTRQLNLDDLWSLDGENRTLQAYTAFSTQLRAAGGSIPRAIAHTYGLSFAVCGLAALFTMACGVFAPAVLHHVIDGFAAPQIDVANLSLWIGAFFASRLTNAFVNAQMGFYLQMVALRLIVSMKSLLFEKAMRRSEQSKTDPRAVDIANLFTTDCSNLLTAAVMLNNLWILPLQITIVVYMLYDVIGAAAFAGLAVIGVSMVVSYVIAKASGFAFQDIMKRKDTRMKAIKEIFGSIQIVKLSAWESKFYEKIMALRAHELSAVARYMYLVAVTIFILWASPLFVSITSFAVYSIGMGQQLTAAKVFTAMALFNAIRDPLRDLPDVVSKCIQAKISLDRMSAFLTIDEHANSNVIRDGAAYPTDVVIDIKNGSFGWTKETALLKNVNMTVKQGDFVVIHGSVGAGKSSLCSAMLGEMDKLDGSVFVRGRVAYYSQQTWIQNMTIRENILFGKAYDEKLYQRALDACGLLPDLEGFPAGDATEIGQKGVNLSGGQKARLCLARACYADADVLILDSPLAAVDAVVQSEIFSKCLCTLLESKTVVLVTHAPDIIASEAANYKVEVVDGAVTGERRDPTTARRSYASGKVREVTAKDTAERSAAASADEGRLVNDEERSEGRVSINVLSQYINAMGGVPVMIMLFVVQAIWQACQIASDFWLSHWTGQKAEEYNPASTQYNMVIYAALGLGSAFMVLVRTVSIAAVGLRASRKLFDGMTRSLLFAPLRFFDATPMGRIVNRYGDDMSSVDFMLPLGFGSILSMIFFCVCQLATAMYTVKFLGVLVVPLVYIYIRVASFYLAPTREISRLAKVSTSPVLSHVTASEEGVALIRAFGSAWVDHAIAENFARIDENNKVWFAQAAVSQWFQLRMQLVGSAVVIVVVSALMYLHAYLTPGIVGLAFTYALGVDVNLSRLVFVWAYTEVMMVSPERISQYASIPAEGDSKILQIEPSPQWPQRGTIDFNNVVFSYKEGGQPVLKGLSFSIQNNEKIGIVGRTGAGKSSLTMALFRINELVSGRVAIDGVDISTMPLQSLRSRLSIIPQAPVLFKGPLRAYMDPFEEYSDEEIWSAFEKVEMKEQIAALEGDLSYELSENGENFSVGERQMLCMARAMLTKSRIVVMDEATASIDHATEKKLQHMINRDFQEATVLTIAHRLATVLDSDRIMVLSDGRVVEFDTPANLVKDLNGVFYELAKEGGVLERLQSVAQ